MLCKFCVKECKNLRSRSHHERLCKLNPNGQISSFVKYNKERDGAWNKGLSKDTDARVKKNSESVKSAMLNLFRTGFRTAAQTQEYWTEERRKEKSDWRKKLHRDFPDSHPNRKVAGNRGKMTYPEQVAFDWLTANNIQFEHQKKILNFYVDFCIDKIIIEIDGEHWHPIGNEQDDKRDLELQQIGFTIHRIRSKEQIQEKLKTILSFA